ncbi:Protein of unknown function (DUF2695) [Desulfitobacterium dichloroeliminans LMG P-21439]|uniref:DUF2695 domain-containing protein n=1 Tax=Desulfitobacterium dichloroeliminans (strain LMG P-21439 / DCA1) TaxID=871963 RepID=L0FAF9_DESDL|nr:DUF2695 domain-containing protein [Desulfitobacterium dichloroeliminans]AGA69636.1 Protein of unknown function (DUF2695) [Desulfitobacterium dichloroeliminans LMG P-21439]
MTFEVTREDVSKEQSTLKDRKKIKEEVNRRLVHGIKEENLEYDSLYSIEKSSINRDSEILSLLFHRMFFYRLNEKLSALHCDHTYRFSRQILTQMQFNRGKINDILEIFKKNGGKCDCGVLYNVESLLIGKDNSHID